MREAVVLEAVRTPVGKRGKSLSKVHPVDLLGDVLNGVVARASIPAEAVEDVVAGCVTQAGEQSANVARHAWLAAGLPEAVPATTIDRQCGSSLQAIQFAAQSVLAGTFDLVLACGVESMSRVPMGSAMRDGPGWPISDALGRRYSLGEHGAFDQAAGAAWIAREWGFGRPELDRLAYESHMRAAAARAEGRFEREILPVEAPTADGGSVAVDTDEGIRPDTTPEQLAGLELAFEGVDLITAGNSSQISDAAAAVLIGTPRKAAELGLRPRARVVGLSTVGVDPVSMLTGPIPATWKVLERTGLGIDDIDLFEVNEAFASVVLAWQRETGAPWDRVNVNGSGISLGHPLGATGARIVTTLLHELERREGRYGLVAICEGGGMANAAIFERLDPTA